MKDPFEFLKDPNVFFIQNGKSAAKALFVVDIIEEELRTNMSTSVQVDVVGCMHSFIVHVKSKEFGVLRIFIGSHDIKSEKIGKTPFAKVRKFEKTADIIFVMNLLKHHMADRLHPSLVMDVGDRVSPPHQRNIYKMTKWPCRSTHSAFENNNVMLAVVREFESGGVYLYVWRPVGGLNETPIHRVRLGGQSEGWFFDRLTLPSALRTDGVFQMFRVDCDRLMNYIEICAL